MRKTNVIKTVIVAAIMTASLGVLTGCSVEKDFTVTETTVDAEVTGDTIEESDDAIFDNDIYSFKYDPEYFVVMEDDEYVTVSFYNEETQTAGSNTITFKQIENADAMDVLKEYAKQYGVDEESIHLSYFGLEGVESYAFSIFPTAEAIAESVSGNQTRSMVCAVPSRDNVIVIEVLTHIEPDEGMDMFINDSIAGVLDTFTVSAK